MNIKNSSEARRNKMLLTPIPKLVTSLAIPTVIIQLIMLAYNTADTYFISQINKSASAAVGSVYAIMALIQAVGFGLGMGASSICSRKLGEEKNEEADLICSSAFFAAFFFGLLLAIFGLLSLKNLLIFIGCSDTMMPYAIPYATFILLAAPIACPTFVCNNALRSEGQSKLSMIGMVASGVLNMILDPIFIFALHLGTAGAAIATGISQFVCFLILIGQFLLKRTVLHIHIKYMSKKAKDYLLILATGFPTICRQGLASIATAALCKEAVQFGDAAVAAITIANKCYSFVRNIVLGLGQGFQPIAGYNYGAKEYDRVKKSFVFATKVGTCFCILCAVLLGIFANEILWWFCPDEAVCSFGFIALRISCFALPFMAFSTYVNQLYQCLGFKAQATFLASLRQGIFFLPITLITPIFIGELGIQMAQPLSDFLTFVVSVPFYYHMSHNLLTKKSSLK